MPRLIDRWRRGREASRSMAEMERLVELAEAGEPAAAARAVAGVEALRDSDPNVAASVDPAQLDLIEARALFITGRAGEALAPAHRAAVARPYDVDSRVTHGLVCLALDRLDEAEHEFESVLEEFGGDPDAEDGRRAVRLARGRVPLDEHALPQDVDTAAALLVRCWRRAQAVDVRLAALRGSSAEGAAIAALERAVV
ncbi:MAG: Flp pilus assembly protein TadD, contains TPR repeats [Chloroflexi bacterium]|nr:MAG: Flp pilus assembly protein TadD, contains TPR repeats [Chloroflexota bacterium]